MCAHTVYVYGIFWNIFQSTVTVVFFCFFDTISFSISSQLSSAKREKDGEDKKRNPILKYIGKPRNTSQSSKYTVIFKPHCWAKCCFISFQKKP